jgi:hypothetical protein
VIKQDKQQQFWGAVRVKLLELDALLDVVSKCKDSVDRINELIGRRDDEQNLLRQARTAVKRPSGRVTKENAARQARLDAMGKEIRELFRPSVEAAGKVRAFLGELSTLEGDALTLPKPERDEVREVFREIAKLSVWTAAASCFPGLEKQMALTYKDLVFMRQRLNALLRTAPPAAAVPELAKWGDESQAPPPDTQERRRRAMDEYCRDHGITRKRIHRELLRYRGQTPTEIYRWQRCDPKTPKVAAERIEKLIGYRR